LALTPLRTDSARLVDWCDRFAEGDSDWQVGELFTCIGIGTHGESAKKERRAS